MRTVRIYRLDITYPPRSHWTVDDWDIDWSPPGWGDDLRAEWAKYREDVDAFRAAGGNTDDPWDSGPMAPRLPLEAASDRFQWPVNRRYFNPRSAENRADLFRKYGATVKVLKSAPVEWSS